jgi:hypothetical protein
MRSVKKNKINKRTSQIPDKEKYSFVALLLGLDGNILLLYFDGHYFL